MEKAGSGSAAPKEGENQNNLDKDSAKQLSKTHLNASTPTDASQDEENQETVSAVRFVTCFVLIYY